MAVSKQDNALNPTPDYGSLGPDADMRTDRPIEPGSANWRRFAAVAAGLMVGLLVVLHQKGMTNIVQSLAVRTSSVQKSLASGHTLNRKQQTVRHQATQNRAQLLLERAVHHSPGAREEIAAQVDEWRGNLTLTPRLNSLITAALNSDDFGVRSDGIEVDLAAMNLAKTSQSADQLIRQASFGPDSQRIWALWTMGLMGNRGVEADRITEFLKQELNNADPQLRQWAVEGMSYLGSDESIGLLMKAFHDDPSPVIRERAACGLAQSGMLSKEQRQTIIPRLLDYAGDSSLDAATQSWAYQALRDITAQTLPNDVAAWRKWHESNAGRASQEITSTAN